MSGDSAPEIRASTRYCAVLGHPVIHSASPAMHNAALAELGLDWRYLAFDVSPDLLPQVLAGAKAMGILGLNLTVPHKLLALPLMDELDETARLWGAVNTVRFEARSPEGDWHPLGALPPGVAGPIRARGYNTDAEAITRAIREELAPELAGARVLLLGAGGVGRVAALKLASEGIGALWLVNRTAAKAEAIAGELRERYPAVAVQVGYPAVAVDLLVNATSLGLKAGEGSPLDGGGYPVSRAKAVFDMIYRPAETPLLAAARAAGCRTANGLGMLLYQGARALEIWAGRPAPLAVMRRALEQNVYGALCK